MSDIKQTNIKKSYLQFPHSQTTIDDVLLIKNFIHFDCDAVIYLGLQPKFH